MGRGSSQRRRSNQASSDSESEARKKALTLPNNTASELTVWNHFENAVVSALGLDPNGENDWLPKV